METLPRFGRRLLRRRPPHGRRGVRPEQDVLRSSSRGIRTFQRPPEGRIFEHLLEENFIPAMTTLIRRECFAERRAVRRVAGVRGLGHVAADRQAIRVRLHALGQRPLSSPCVLALADARRPSAGERDIRIFLEAPRIQPRVGPVLRDRIARAAYRLDRPEQLSLRPREPARRLESARRSPLRTVPRPCAVRVRPLASSAPWPRSERRPPGLVTSAGPGGVADRDAVVAVDLRDHDGRVPGDERVGRHVASYDRARGDHRVCSDRDRVVDDGPRTDERPRADRHVAASVAPGPSAA